MTKLGEVLTGKVGKLMMGNESLKAQVNVLLDKLYGRSREKGSYVDENQLALFNDEDLNIFNEPEIASDPNSEEPKMVEVITKKKKRKSKHDHINNTVPIKEVARFLEGEDGQCEWCNSELRPIGREEVRREIEFIPTTLQVKGYIRHAYEYPTCKADGEDVIVKSKAPKPIILKSVAFPSAVAWLLHQKYEQYMPFNRQKSEWQRAGIELSRTTMANWAIKFSKDYLAPLYESLRKERLKNHILFADETTVLYQVPSSIALYRQLKQMILMPSST
jgi:transposase